MNRLYEVLERIDDLEGRRVVIKDYLASVDLTDLLTEAEEISEEQTVPDMKDRMCFPFVVGNKYFRRKCVRHDQYPSYLLGIVKADETVSLLVVEPENEKLSFLARDEMHAPVHTADRRYKDARDKFKAENSKRMGW